MDNWLLDDRGYWFLAVPTREYCPECGHLFDDTEVILDHTGVVIASGLGGPEAIAAANSTLTSVERCEDGWKVLGRVHCPS
jgi:hypothetical protein